VGAGDQLAGDGLAGDELDLPVAGVALSPPAAIHFDAVTRDFPRDENGRFFEIHPVDSRVQMALAVALGGIASSTTTGNALRRIKYLNPRRIKAQATDAIRQAMAPIVADGDATVAEVIVEQRQRHAVIVQVDYFNERLPDRPRRSLSATLS
jgi:hypothetical protein